LDEKGYASDGRCIVRVDPRYFRPAEVDSLLGNPAKAAERLGWRPRTKFQELVSEMVDADLQIAKRDELVRRHGFHASAFNE
jgi:GDPmannose 4,6-dehydratase